MKPVIMEHPLIQYKISLLRDKGTGTKEFRELVHEISLLMGYEATRDLPLTKIELQTPLTQTMASVIGKKIAIVFQNPDNQFIGATVEDDIAFGLENKQFPHNKMQEEIEKFADSVNMLDYLKKEPTNLSGGQKQRVAIAGALILRPEVLILDEATSMLDPKGKSTVRKVIDRIHKENPDLAIISITHDIDEALLADQVFILSHGKLVGNGKPQEILRDRKTLLDLKLEQPFIYRFEKKLNDIGISSHAESIEQLVEDIWASK